VGEGAFLALEALEPEEVRTSDAAGTGWREGLLPGWHLIALRIPAEDREKVASHLAAHGVEIVHRSRWTLYVRDPEGNRVGLSHHPDDAA
jgi:glyoxylase I family protein